jgi:hypothetical protein
VSREKTKKGGWKGWSAMGDSSSASLSAFCFPVRQDKVRKDPNGALQDIPLAPEHSELTYQLFLYNVHLLNFFLVTDVSLMSTYRFSLVLPT